jgi:DNA-binding NarL/FixJ family response regulator
MDYLFRRGIDQGYLLHEEQTARLRGRIHVTQTVRCRAWSRPQAVCQFDELSPNVLHNQIIRATAESLMCVPSVNSGLRDRLFRQIRARRPDTKIIVLTMYPETQLAVDAFRAGASGYLLKVSPGEELIAAIGQVALGRAYVTTLLAKDLITLLLEAVRETSTADTPLTPRQREVLQLIAEGRTMKEVGSILNISARTAESHKYEIMKVLGLETTAALIQHAIRLKLVAE